MPRVPLVNEQYRNAIGNYTNTLDKKYGNQRAQNERVKALARNPGLHSGNHNRQNVAQALVQLTSILSVVSNSTIHTASGIDNPPLTAQWRYRTSWYGFNGEHINPLRTSVFASNSDCSFYAYNTKKRHCR